MSSRVKIYPTTGALLHKTLIGSGLWPTLAPNDNIILSVFGSQTKTPIVASISMQNIGTLSTLSVAYSNTSATGNGSVAFRVDAVNTALKVNLPANTLGVVTDNIHVIPINASNRVSYNLQFDNLSGTLEIDLISMVYTSI